MWKIASFLGCMLVLSPVALGDANLTHLERLKSRYPYGLIGDDYGLLTEEDLAINACGVLSLTPFSGEKNMAYPYWQCFPVKDAKMECDSLGYDPTIKKETGHMAIDALGNGGLQSYLARDAMEMRDCRRWLQIWKEKTRGEKYVCLSGPYGAFSGIRDGQKETGWVFDKFKTRRGCKSFFSGECGLKKEKGC